MALFCTSFCNCAHRLCDGLPVNHECYVLLPAALRGEMAGTYEVTADSMVKQPRRRHPGVRADKPLTLHFYYSEMPYGWVRVAREELQCYGLLSKVSDASYQKEDWVYLEYRSSGLLFLKGCDASLLFDALQEHSRPYTLKEHDSKTKESVILSYDRFKA